MNDMLLDPFARFAHAKLGDYLAQITRCAGLLNESQFWHRANSNCNSVGILTLHLTGNVRQWILGGVGGVTIHRDRPAEFQPAQLPPVSEVVLDVSDTIESACDVIRSISPQRWGEPVCIQGYSTTVLGVVFHVVEHFAFHTGQIVHITKSLCNVDMSLYDAQGRRTDGRTSEAP